MDHVLYFTLLLMLGSLTFLIWAYVTSMPENVEPTPSIKAVEMYLAKRSQETIETARQNILANIKKSANVVQGIGHFVPEAPHFSFIGFSLAGSGVNAISQAQVYSAFTCKEIKNINFPNPVWPDRPSRMNDFVWGTVKSSELSQTNHFSVVYGDKKQGDLNYHLWPLDEEDPMFFVIDPGIPASYFTAVGPREDIGFSISFEFDFDATSTPHEQEFFAVLTVKGIPGHEFLVPLNMNETANVVFKVSDFTNFPFNCFKLIPGLRISTNDFTNIKGVKNFVFSCYALPGESWDLSASMRKHIDDTLPKVKNNINIPCTTNSTERLAFYSELGLSTDHLTSRDKV